MLQMSFFLLAISILDAIITTDDNNVNIVVTSEKT